MTTKFLTFIKGLSSNVYAIGGTIIFALYSLFRIEISEKQTAQAKLETADSNKKDAVLNAQEQDVQKQIEAIQNAPVPSNVPLDQLAKDLNS